jgi:glycosyltransferase involved in cell wall biosynthesis
MGEGKAAPQASHPRVSIGVPVYNGERFLATTLDSLIAQTFGDVEIIICDNASTDTTEAIGRSYAACDPRIRYLRNAENIGAARNFNRCLELARGEFFRWASADDVADPSLVERCVEILDQHPDVVQVYGRTRLIDGDGNEISEYDDNLRTLSDSPRERFSHILRNLGLVNAIYGLLRTEVLRRTRGHASYLGADMVMQAEIALHGKIWELPEVLFSRRMHAKAHSAMSLQEKQEFYNPQGSTSSFSFWHWRHLWEHLAAVHRAHLPLYDRVALSGMLVRHAIGNRESFIGELFEASKAQLHRFT